MAKIHEVRKELDAYRDAKKHHAYQYDREEMAYHSGWRDAMKYAKSLTDNHKQQGEREYE